MGFRHLLEKLTFFRYDEFVQSLTSAEEVEALAFCSSFAPHVVSDKKLQNFIDKVLELIHSGHLDPAKVLFFMKLTDSPDSDLSPELG